LVKKVAVLFPAKEIITFMDFSEASLFNDPDKDCFRHKILINGERRHSNTDEARDRTKMIRQLLSEKRIDRRTSVRSGDGWVAKQQEFDGPVAYAETTTSHSIFEEDLNRMLQIYTDDSEEQNRGVMEAVAQRYNGRRDDKGSHQPEDVQAVIDKHHEFQKWLK